MIETLKNVAEDVELAPDSSDNAEEGTLLENSEDASSENDPSAEDPSTDASTEDGPASKEQDVPTDTATALSGTKGKGALHSK